MRRLLAVVALAAFLFVAFALIGGSNLSRVGAASTSSVLTLLPSSNTQQGCPLGPAFTFCDQAPTTASPAVQFNVQAVSSVTFGTTSAAIAAIPGLAANFAAGDFVISGNTCSGQLPASGTCQISIAFSPTTTGLRQAQVTVTDSASDTLVFNVEGTGSQLALAPPAPPNCTPAVLPDNAFVYCATPATQTFTLTSGAGATNVNVTLAAIPGLESEFSSGGSADFTIQTPPCPSTIPAGGSCSIGVAFSPTTAGMRSATLIATDSSGDRTTIYVAGSAAGALAFNSVAPGGSQPCGMTNHFLFCNLPVGGVSPGTTLSLVNSSGTQVTGLSVPKGSVIAQGATAPDFTVQSTSCASVLPAGASCNVTVAFTPTTTGLRQGAVVITDAQGDSTAVNLAGVGDDYSIATQLPTELSVVPGSAVTFNATLTPDNVLGMNGEQVTFVCPTNLPTNTSCVVAPCPATITPSTTVGVKVLLVTSSAAVVAPIPSSGCSSYGPSLAELIGAPTGQQAPPPGTHGGPIRSSPVLPALIGLAALGAIGLLMAGVMVPGSTDWRRRAALIITSTGLAAAMLTGCHHHAATNTTATPIGSTTLTVLGNAIDASGNSLNASRTFQVTLDVVAK